MHTPSPMALLLIAIVVLVLFGRGKVSSLMGEVGKGINAFKQGVKESSDDVNSAGKELTDEMNREDARRDQKLRDVTPHEVPRDRDRV